MKNIVLMMMGLFVFSSCMSDKALEEKVAKILKENPKLVIETIEKNPTDFVEAFQKAVNTAREGMAKNREAEEKKQLEESFSNPLVPNIRKDESIRGAKNAPLMLVEYSDFQCPFCSRGYETVMELMKKYDGKVSFVYKHLPLSFHPQAEIAARYYEAIRLQNENKAYKFHDEIFKNQSKLKNGEGFLKSLAKEVGADMGKLAKDINSEAVSKRIEEDTQEAAKFGMQGTPGFLLNGVPVRGAYPVSHFEQIVEELKKRGKVNL